LLSAPVLALVQLLAYYTSGQSKNFLVTLKYMIFFFQLKNKNNCRGVVLWRKKINDCPVWYNYSQPLCGQSFIFLCKPKPPTRISMLQPLAAAAAAFGSAGY